MNGFWQSARSFFTGQEAETTTPALTPEGAALGFEWEVRDGKQEGTALLWPQGPEAMETGPLAGIDKVHPAAGWTVNGGEDRGFTKNEAMIYAEVDAAKHSIEPLADASESYYAKLSALAESRGADMERGNDFDVER